MTPKLILHKRKMESSNLVGGDGKFDKWTEPEEGIALSIEMASARKAPAALLSWRNFILLIYGN
jgi:hypothetical protein